MQKIIYVYNAESENIELNADLKDGWIVVSVTALHVSAGQSYGRGGGAIIVLSKTKTITL